MHNEVCRVKFYRIKSPKVKPHLTNHIYILINYQIYDKKIPWWFWEEETFGLGHIEEVDKVLLGELTADPVVWTVIKK